MKRDNISYVSGSFILAADSVVLFVESLSEVPPGCICIPRHSSPAWDLNLGCSFRKSCNVLVVSGLAAVFCLAAGFRCFPFPLNLNQWRCLLNPCNGKSLNVLQRFV